MTDYQKLMNKRVAKWQKVCHKHSVVSHDVTNLVFAATAFILPHLRAYYECVDSMPGDLNFRQWRSKLRSMIAAFELIERDDGLYSVKDDARIKAGLADFAKYFRSLWL